MITASSQSENTPFLTAGLRWFHHLRKTHARQQSQRQVPDDSAACAAVPKLLTTHLRRQLLPERPYTESGERWESQSASLSAFRSGKCEQQDSWAQPGTYLDLFSNNAPLLCAIYQHQPAELLVLRAVTKSSELGFASVLQCLLQSSVNKYLLWSPGALFELLLAHWHCCCLASVEPGTHGRSETAGLPNL